MKILHNNENKRTQSTMPALQQWEYHLKRFAIGLLWLTENNYKFKICILVFVRSAHVPAGEDICRNLLTESGLLNWKKRESRTEEVDDLQILLSPFWKISTGLSRKMFACVSSCGDCGLHNFTQESISRLNN